MRSSSATCLKGVGAAAQKLRLVWLTLASYILSAAIFQAAAEPNARPNVIWIIADDLGTELSCYGTPQVETPNLDHFAAEGPRSPRCFTTAPVCSSSRSAIMTAMYQT